MRPLAAALGLALLTAAPAGAADVTTDRACYLQTRSTNVTVNGSGFAPSRPYTVSLDGQPLDGGGALTDASGAMQGTISPPTIDSEAMEQTFSVGVQADDMSASTTFTVTKFSADFTPSERIAPDSRVRFSVYGFGLAVGNADVYLHYVDPAGRLRQTVRLGRAQGQCGSIARTARRRLFPMQRPRRGKWQLQFDTAKGYTRGQIGSPFLFYTIGVNVRSAGSTPRTAAGSLGLQAP
jgi:hypothetical protein